MRQAAFWSGYGRGACGLLAAACVALAVAGCSSTSRFDFPAFNLTSSESDNTDPAATAALPVPEESVYSSGAADGRLARASLPPPSYTPRPSAAAYSPQPSGRVGAERANYPSQSAPQAEPAVLRASKVSGRRIKVAKGDTLSILARRYGVSVEAIMSANHLPDGRLNVGQELIMPGVAAGRVAEAAPSSAQSTYKVQKGDTPHDIAEKLGVDEKALIERNNLNPNNLRIGRVLIVPGKGKPTAPTNVAAEETNPPASEESPETKEASAPAPNSGPAVRVVKTTTIKAPGGTSLAEEEAQEDAAADAKTDTEQGGAANEIAASPEITGEDSPRVASNDQLPAPDPMSGNSFRWPVKGRVVAEFGAQPNGGHNDGIDMAVPQGTSVMAAENGVVAYAGNELKGYGNLVLVRHANNWVSAYANNEEIMVKRGDKVRRGQVIAKAGATGSVSQPQVHFELRKGSRPVDPTKYMSGQAANAD